MASDGRTIQRGPSPGPDGQPPGWLEAASPERRRLPSAPRERKPALAALALLLIVGGALGAAYLVLRSGQRVAAIEISQPVGVGERIPVSAMREVQVASGTGLQYVPWDEASQVARYRAGTTIPPGTLLTRAMVVSAGNVTVGKAVMGLSLKDGQLPRGLQVGDRIDIYEVSNSTPACPGAPGQALARDAVVLAIASPSAASGSAATDVEVAVAPADAGKVACNASNGLVSVVTLPASGAAPPAGGTSAQPPAATTPPRAHSSGSSAPARARSSGSSTPAPSSSSAPPSAGPTTVPSPTG